MPLAVTPSYEHCLRELRAVSGNTAHLAERIAVNLNPQVVSISPVALQTQLFQHMHALGLQQAHSTTRLAGWLNSLARQGGISHRLAAILLDEAVAVYDQAGVVSE